MYRYNSFFLLVWEGQTLFGVNASKIERNCYGFPVQKAVNIQPHCIQSILGKKTWLLLFPHLVERYMMLYLASRKNVLLWTFYSSVLCVVKSKMLWEKSNECISSYQDMLLLHRYSGDMTAVSLLGSQMNYDGWLSKIGILFLFTVSH